MNENFQREFKAVLPCWSTGTRVNREMSIRSRTPTIVGKTIGKAELTSLYQNGIKTQNSCNGNSQTPVVPLKSPKKLQSSYLVGKTESNADIKLIPDSQVTVL